MSDEIQIDPEELRRAEAAWERAAAEADATLQLPKADGSGTVPMFFRRILAGSFRMGLRGTNSSEEPIHRVKISHDFYCGTFPVTQAQFAAFREEHENYFSDRPQNPAEPVFWKDAQAFIVWMNQSAVGMPSGFEAALPSEAQWEYACRAGSETDYSSGDGEQALREVGWFDGNSGSGTHPVGALKANDWGLYDMHGNVLEWCDDVWDPNAYRKRSSPWNGADEVGIGSSDYPPRVIRGGSWNGSAWWCRSAYRDRGWLGDRFGVLGFRLVLVPVSDSPEPDSSAGGEEGAGAVSDELQVAWDEDASLPDIDFRD